MLPHVSHAAIGLLSAVVSRRPAATLRLLDPETTEKVLYEYIAEVFQQIRSPCCVENRFGIAYLLTALPVLYHLGDWPNAKAVLSRAALCATLASLACNMLHQLSEGMVPDTPPDLRTVPELNGCSVPVRLLFGEAGEQLIWRMPGSAAVAGIIETLGRWSARGVLVSEARVPCAPPPAVARRMNRAQLRDYSEPVSQCLEEYIPRLEDMARSRPQFAYTVPIARAIAEGRTARLPSETSQPLLRVHLHAGMVCALPSCARTTSDEGGSLRRCNGGCSSLARYCCAQHKQMHWAVHRGFCKR
jgi:hypothetical protein